MHTVFIYKNKFYENIEVEISFKNIILCIENL